MIFNTGSGGAGTAEQMKYDNAESGLQADNVQGAIDEVSDSLGRYDLLHSTNANSNSFSEATINDITKYKFLLLYVKIDGVTIGSIIVPTNLFKAENTSPSNAIVAFFANNESGVLKTYQYQIYYINDTKIGFKLYKDGTCNPSGCLYGIG